MEDTALTAENSWGRELIHRAHCEFSGRFWPMSVTIAGGAVRDALMARVPKDIDVFVHGWLSKKAAASSCRGLDVVTLSGSHNSEPFLVGTWQWRPLIQRYPDRFQVQVMATPYQDAWQLMDSFDWNVCLFAYDGGFKAKTDLDDIAPGKELKLNRVTFPASTLRRGYRFSERFGMALPASTVDRLCGEVICRRTLERHKQIPSFEASQ